jgi:hypothetical protein
MPAPMSDSPPRVEQAPQSPPVADAPAASAPKPVQTHTVWSSTPGDGHHFEPKE